MTDIQDSLLRFSIVTVTCVAVATIGMGGCTKDDRSQVAELVSQLEHVREWRYDVEASRGHVPWLQAKIAWDILGAQLMMSATADPETGTLGVGLDELLKSGLAELAAGPAPRDMIAEVDSWRVELGKGACAVTQLASDDAAWLKVQLTLAPPKGAAAAARAALEGYAKRAAGVHAAARITCGGTAALVVGTLDSKLVPLLRK